MALKNYWSLDKACLTAGITKTTKYYGHPPREGASTSVSPAWKVRNTLKLLDVSNLVQGL